MDSSPDSLTTTLSLDRDGDLLSELELERLFGDFDNDLLLLLDGLDFLDESELDLTVFLEMWDDLEDAELFDRLGLELGDLLFSLDFSPSFCASGSASSSEFSLIRLNNMSTSLLWFSSIMTRGDV